MKWLATCWRTVKELLTPCPVSTVICGQVGDVWMLCLCPGGACEKPMVSGDRRGSMPLVVSCVTPRADSMDSLSSAGSSSVTPSRFMVSSQLLYSVLSKFCRTCFNSLQKRLRLQILSKFCTFLLMNAEWGRGRSPIIPYRSATELN